MKRTALALLSLALLAPTAQADQYEVSPNRGDADALAGGAGGYLAAAQFNTQITLRPLRADAAPGGPSHVLTRQGFDSDLAHNTRANEYLATWTTSTQPSAVQFQRAAADGTLIGTAQAIPSARDAAVTWSPATGEYLVVWQSLATAGSFTTLAQRVDAGGGLIAAPVTVATETDGTGARPTVEANPAGGFALAVRYESSRTFSSVVRVTALDGAGSPAGPAAAAISSTIQAVASKQYRPQIAWSSKAGAYLLVADESVKFVDPGDEEPIEGTEVRGVAARVIGADGAPRGLERELAPVGRQKQLFNDATSPTVTAQDAGWLVAWSAGTISGVRLGASGAPIGRAGALAQAGNSNRFPQLAGAGGADAVLIFEGADPLEGVRRPARLLSRLLPGGESGPLLKLTVKKAGRNAIRVTCSRACGVDAAAFRFPGNRAVSPKVEKNLRAKRSLVIRLKPRKNGRFGYVLATDDLGNIASGFARL